MSSHRKVDGGTRLRFFVCETEWTNCANKSKCSQEIRINDHKQSIHKDCRRRRKPVSTHEVGFFLPARSVL